MAVWTLEGLMMLTGIFLVGPIGLALLLSWLLKRWILARRIVLGLFALYFLALGSLMAWRHAVPSVYPWHGMPVKWHRTLAELEGDSVHIIRGRMLKNSGQSAFYHGKPKWYEANIVGGHTLSLFSVEGVYKGQLKPGYVITVWEPYYRDRGIEGAYLVCHEMYLPMRKGQDYILFLDQDYRLLSAHMGKHIVHTRVPGNKDLTAKRLQVNPMPFDQLNLYIPLHLEVIEKFLLGPSQ